MVMGTAKLEASWFSFLPVRDRMLLRGGRGGEGGTQGSRLTLRLQSRRGCPPTTPFWEGHNRPPRGSGQLGSEYCLNYEVLRINTMPTKPSTFWYGRLGPRL
ncbi:hypothetical protein EYF80_005500 [Liparis tanakae]|uniref:Uncharacterized protein n=1 Tax=Liparis tanakae TaxID=230148 RepID=A0A4Z2J3U2_9TELE|nr:hypothetical protein EYF80_005500 [Liparis tanakae]